MQEEIRSQSLLRVKGSTENSCLQRTPKGTPLIRQVCNIPEFILLFQVTLTSLSPYIIESWYMISSVFDLESSLFVGYLSKEGSFISSFRFSFFSAIKFYTVRNGKLKSFTSRIQRTQSCFKNFDNSYKMIIQFWLRPPLARVYFYPCRSSWLPDR